ncbi:Ankyrin repeat, SAM and basic leucine zipper domain-containing protein 1 [Nymphon striatum]|nr:Ankyrin repeat, SAM and basic leucine zipper domain-containing protein 1 [Nymphon striatum]
MSTAMCPGGMESDCSDDDFLYDYNDETSNISLGDISLKGNTNSGDKETKICANGNVSPVAHMGLAHKLDNYKKTITIISSKICDRIQRQSIKMLNAKVNTTDMVDDMRVAVVRNQVSAAKIYLKQDMFTPLMAVCSSKQNNEAHLQKCIESLIKAGANVDDFERHHETALMLATREGRLEIVSYLIKNNASLNLIDNRGWTALFWAACKGYGQIVRVLLENKADASIVSFSGQTASDLANSYGYLVIGKTLQDYMDSDKSPEAKENLMKGLPVKDKRDTPIMNESFVSYGELEMFLMGQNLQDLIPLFTNHDIKFPMLLKMDENDLEKIGVHKLGNRHTILKAIAALHKKDWKKSSIPNLRNKVLITSADVAHIIHISSQHISFIDSSVHYVQKQLLKNSQILQLDKVIYFQVPSISHQVKFCAMTINKFQGQSLKVDKADVQAMEEFTTTSIENCEKLMKQLKSLKTHFVSIRSNVEHLPVDCITKNNDKKKGSSFWRYGTIIAIVGLFGFLINKEKINIVIKQHPWL